MKRPGPDILRLAMIETLLAARFEREDILKYLNISERTYYRDAAQLRHFAEVGRKLG